MARRGKGNDKFLRLTGLWPSKKRDGLWSGKLRNQDIERLLERAKEADGEGADIIFFLWENEKQSKKDPEFTLQCAVAEDQGGYSKGRDSGRSRRDRDEDDEKPSRRGKKEEKEDEEEEETPRSKKGKSTKDNDW